MKIYVASSWRNPHQQDVVRLLRAAGHDVYDFRREENGLPGGFQWTQIEGFKSWPPSAFSKCLTDPAARYGYNRDMTALRGADACVLVLPCNRSAHFEAGYALGESKRVVVFYPPGIEPQEPELMYSECLIAGYEDELLVALEAEP